MFCGLRCCVKLVVEFLIGPLPADITENAIHTDADIDSILQSLKSNGKQNQHSALIDVWTAFSAAIEQLETRRIATNAFFTVVFAASINVFGPQFLQLDRKSVYWLFLGSLVGIRISTIWIALLAQYDSTIKRKRKIVMALEKCMVVQVLTTESKMESGAKKTFSSIEVQLAYLARISYVVGVGICICKILRFWKWL